MTYRQRLTKAREWVKREWSAPAAYTRKLEALLDAAPHSVCQDIFSPGYEVDCAEGCARCKWEAMKRAK